MRAKIEKCTLSGKIKAPGSKSMAHRLLICAALADGTSTIRGITPCEDIKATVDCLLALGAKITNIENNYTITGIDIRKAESLSALYCRESGSTLRFIIPLASLTNHRVIISGSPYLMKRPMSVYKDLFSERGLEFIQDEEKIIQNGSLSPGEYTVRGDISSQFITGLLFALPLLDKKSVIKILPPFESRSYIDLTLIALAQFGIEAHFTDPLTIEIPGGQKYMPQNTEVEGDYSGAAFIDAFGILGDSVESLGLLENSAQGDKIYKEFYPQLRASNPHINIENCPDLGPILFTLAAFFNGATFTGTARLKMKESDRALVMAEELKKFGADIEINSNSVIVNKVPLHAPKDVLYGHNDHRVVMSLSVLLTRFGGEIKGVEAVGKSYPDFFTDIKSIGAEVTLYD